MNIARNHEVNQVPESVEMNPTSLPELSKQPRTSKTLRKPNILETKQLETYCFTSYILALEPFKAL